jgi:hypothetical protein
MNDNPKDKLELTPALARELIEMDQRETEAGNRYLDPAAYDYLLEYLLKDLGYPAEQVDELTCRTLNPAEVAAFLHNTSETVRVWVNAGRLKAQKISPRKWRISGRDLAELIVFS